MYLERCERVAVRERLPARRIRRAGRSLRCARCGHCPQWLRAPAHASPCSMGCCGAGGTASAGFLYRSCRGGRSCWASRGRHAVKGGMLGQGCHGRLQAAPALP